MLQLQEPQAKEDWGPYGQCLAVTARHKRCARKANKPDGYCGKHPEG